MTVVKWLLLAVGLWYVYAYLRDRGYLPGAVVAPVQAAGAAASAAAADAASAASVAASGLLDPWAMPAEGGSGYGATPAEGGSVVSSSPTSAGNFLGIITTPRLPYISRPGSVSRVSRVLGTVATSAPMPLVAGTTGTATGAAVLPARYLP